MAERDSRQRTNDPVTAPEAEKSVSHQSDVNAGRGDSEAASRARARRSGRTAAKVFGIGLVLLVLIVLFGGFIGGDAGAPVGEVEPGG